GDVRPMGTPGGLSDVQPRLGISAGRDNRKILRAAPTASDSSSADRSTATAATVLRARVVITDGVTPACTSTPALHDQAVPQARPGTAHRNHHHQRRGRLLPAPL